MNNITIFSAFDGMSNGQIALNKAGVPYDRYFASEINKSSINITQKNYPNTVQLGDIKKVINLPKIDLFLGGFPCQSFSFSGKHQGFDDPKGMLFFEIVRLMEKLKPKYFLFENVKMIKKYHTIITKHLKVKPIIINSNRFSAQDRERYYWTNIKILPFPEYNKFQVKDILEKNVNEKYFINKKITYTNKIKRCIGYIKNNFQGNRVYAINNKSICLCGNAGGGGAKMGLYLIDGRIRKLTPIECEALQTVPRNFTSGETDNIRYKMLGNGWTVDVIAHIFKGLKYPPVNLMKIIFGK